jgi:hypothetical protein
VASKIEESDIDGIRVVACDGEVNGCSRVFIDHSESAQIGNVSSIDQRHSGLEAPVGRHSQNCILYVRIGLSTSELFYVFHDHAHQLLQGKRILSLSEEVSAIFEAIPLKRSPIERFDELVQVEVSGLGLLQALGVSIVLKVAHSIQEANLHIIILTPL